MKIKLSKFGCSLSSRLKGREVFELIKSDIIVAEKIILDFENIEIMTFSFGTELFNSISEYSEGQIEILNSNEFLKDVITFCRRQNKEMAV
jgi:hypothetical protein